MSMLNPFPIQWLALFAYLILRVCLGLVLVALGFHHWRSRRSLAGVFTFRLWPYGQLSAILLPLAEIILGTLMLIGWNTQYAAIVVALMALKLCLLRPWFPHPSIPSRLTYVLMLSMALSLFITGAGALAVDLPL